MLHTNHSIDSILQGPAAMWSHLKVDLVMAKLTARSAGVSFRDVSVNKCQQKLSSSKLSQFSMLVVHRYHGTCEGCFSTCVKAKDQHANVWL